MIDTVVKITCDWCGDWQESSKNRTRIGEKTLRKKAEKWGWLKIINGNGSINDFCGNECYKLHKKDESNP